MRKLVTIVQTVGEDDSDSEILTAKNLARRSRNQRGFGPGSLTAEGAKNAKAEIGLSPAKTPRRKGDGPRSVIPSKCEGSKKDFSPVELRPITPRGRNDKESFFPNLASLRLGGRNVRIRAFLAPGKFAQAAKTLSYSNTRFSPDCAGEKRFALSANSRNRNSEYLPQRRQGRKGRRKHVKIFRKNICLFPPNFASLRLCGKHIRIRESSITGKFTQAARYDKHVGLCFRIAMQRKSNELSAFASWRETQFSRSLLHPKVPNIFG